MSGRVSEDIERLAQSRIGQTLRGKLRLDRLLGLGGTAAVYAATHRTGKRYAVKILHPQLMFDARIRERFFREGYVVNRIEHPGVVCISDDDVDDDGALFLVMDLLEGETVDALALRSGGRLPEPEVLRIADETLDVLVAAHARGIVHRDLKPENLFLTRDGGVKVLDFGIARLLELGGRTLATRAGTVMGTPAFMPPEQARGHVEVIDARSDIWALGASMFALLTGRAVHQARTANELLLAAMRSHAPKLRDVMPDVDEELARIVDRALAYAHADRWHDAVSMQSAIRLLRLRDQDAPQSAPAFDPEATVKNDPAIYAATEPRDAQSVGVSPSTEITAVRPGSVSALGPTHLATSGVLLRRTMTGGTNQAPDREASADAAEAIDAFMRRGAARAAGGDLAGAAEDFTSAIDLDPRSALAHYNRAVVRQRQGQFSEGLSDYGAALALAPDFPEAHFNTSLCLQKAGDLLGARTAALAAAALYDAASRKAEGDAARRLANALAGDTLVE